MIPDYITPGAIVRLRGNRKARIYATDGSPKYPIHGAILDGSGWSIQLWTEAGHYYDSEPEHGRSIVGPWIDEPDASKLWPLLPPWIKWVAKDRNAIWFGYPDEPRLAKPEGIWVSETVCWIAPDYAPTFTGDWTKSRIRRPTV